jgi:Zn-dependent protease with chaperone function
MKAIAQSFIAILLGFVAIVGLSGITAAILKKVAPSLADENVPADPFVMAVNVGIGLATSVLGGYITARFSQGNPLIHALVLALVVLLFSAFSAVQMKNKQPVYYLLILTVIPTLAVLCGGLLRLYQLGIRW